MIKIMILYYNGIEAFLLITDLGTVMFSEASVCLEGEWYLWSHGFPMDLAYLRGGRISGGMLSGVCSLRLGYLGSRVSRGQGIQG